MSACVELYCSVLFTYLVDGFHSSGIAVIDWRCLYVSDLPAMMLNEAKTSRPELRGRGQFLEVETKAEVKNNYEKSTKCQKNSQILHNFCTKMPGYIIRRHWGQAEAKILAAMPLWPRGLNTTAYQSHRSTIIPYRSWEHYHPAVI